MLTQARHGSKCFTSVNSFSLTRALRGRYYYDSHFTEPQKSEVTHSRSHTLVKVRSG